MNLKNYTSTVTAAKSIQHIEEFLVEVGANQFQKIYEDKKLKSIFFQFSVNGLPIFFQIPANVEAVKKVLWAEVKRPQAGTEQKIESQAERTAWKIVSDWVEIQVSMIKLEQVEFLQVFLPYAYNQEHDKTFFQQLKENNFKQLSG